MEGEKKIVLTVSTCQGFVAIYKEPLQGKLMPIF